MRTIQYNSNNCLPPEFKRTSCEKRNNLNELINIPMKAGERSMIQISFSTQDPNIKTGTIRNPRQKLHPIHDPLCFQNPRIRSIFRTNPQSVRFLRSNPSIQKTYSPPSVQVQNFTNSITDLILPVIICSILWDVLFRTTLLLKKDSWRFCRVRCLTFR